MICTCPITATSPSDFKLTISGCDEILFSILPQEKKALAKDVSTFMESVLEIFAACAGLKFISVTQGFHSK